jgi:hypothetical protein
MANVVLRHTFGGEALLETGAHTTPIDLTDFGHRIRGLRLAVYDKDRDPWWIISGTDPDRKPL